MIRTTISLQDSVLKAVKRLARDENRTLGDTITELLQIALRERDRNAVPANAKLPRFDMGHAFVSLEDKERLNQLLDGGKP